MNGGGQGGPGDSRDSTASGFPDSPPDSSNDAQNSAGSAAAQTTT